MPAINLPAINIDKEDFKSKETMENILDTLIKYRKELNYLLMNLDIDNMPLVGGLIGEIEGNYSLLTQTVDGIYMQVGNIEGDMADFRVEADNISAMVTNQSGDIAALVVRAGSIESTVASHTGQISSVVQTASSLTSTVAALDTEVGGFYSEISQLAGEISSIVSFTDVTGNQIASKINQTATNVTIAANKIDLTGVTKIYSPNSTTDYVEFSGESLSIKKANQQVFRIQIDAFGTGIQFFSPNPSYPSSHFDLMIESPLKVKRGLVTYGAVDFSNATSITGLTMKFA